MERPGVIGLDRHLRAGAAQRRGIELDLDQARRSPIRLNEDADQLSRCSWHRNCGPKLVEVVTDLLHAEEEVGRGSDSGGNKGRRQFLTRLAERIDG